MRAAIALLTPLLIAAPAAAADQTVDAAPASSLVLIQPLSIEQAKSWSAYAVVTPVREKEGVLFDAKEAERQGHVIQAVTYFRGANGQMYAVVTWLRPRDERK